MQSPQTATINAANIRQSVLTATVAQSLACEVIKAVNQDDFSKQNMSYEKAHNQQVRDIVRQQFQTFLSGAI